jgi:hypothetical protein
VALALPLLGALAIGGSPATAQLLRLEGTPAPAAGDGRSLPTLAERLGAEASRHLEQARSLPEGSMGAIAAGLSGEFRRLATLVALRGEALGERGSVHAVTARTLAAATAEVDLIAARVAAGGEAGLGAMLAARQFIRDMGTLGTDEAAAAAAIPAAPPELDRFVRDLLAMLIEAQPGGAGSGSPAWPMDAEPVAEATVGEAVAAWRSAGLIRGETAARFAEFAASVLAPAEGLAAYRGQARGVWSEASGTGATLVGLPTWLGDGGRGALAARFDRAIAALTDRATQADAVEALRALRQVGETAARLDAAAAGEGGAGARGLAAAREALTGEGSAWRVEAFDRASRLLAERRALGGAEGVVRELRPAWRALEVEARRAEGDLWTALQRVAGGGPSGESTGASVGGGASDPALVGAMAALRRVLDDLLAMQTISAALGEKGVFEGASRRLALASVLRVAQEVGRAGTRESALRAIRAAGSDLGELLSFPGEADLRAGGGEWAALSGGRAGDLAAAIDTARRAWLNGWSAGSSAAETEHLRWMRQVVGVTADAATVRRMGAAAAAGQREGIGAWPGWKVSAPGLAALTDGLEGPLSRATAAAIAGDGRAVARALAEAGPRLALVQTAAALDRAARARGVAAAPALLEAACPPGPGAWMTEWREEVAAVCRYAEDAAESSRAGDTAGAERALAYAAARAEGLLKRLDR